MDGCIFSRELVGVMNYRNIPTLSVKFYNFYPAHFLSLAHLFQELLFLRHFVRGTHEITKCEYFKLNLECAKK